MVPNTYVFYEDPKEDISLSLAILLHPFDYLLLSKLWLKKNVYLFHYLFGDLFHFAQLGIACF